MYTCGINRFSHDVAQMIVSILYYMIIYYMIMYLYCKSLCFPLGIDFSTVSSLEGQVEQADSIYFHNVESIRSVTSWETGVLFILIRT